MEYGVVVVCDRNKLVQVNSDSKRHKWNMIMLLTLDLLGCNDTYLGNTMIVCNSFVRKFEQVMYI